MENNVEGPNMSGVALKDVSSTLFCIAILLHDTSISH
jgi:hypothetical protein